MKMKNDALLEELAQRCGCLYLSDLRRPSAVNRMMILTTLQGLNAGDYPLNQWKRVWLYLTDLPLPAERTASDLREALLEQLTSPKTPIHSEQTGHGKAWAKRGKPQRTK
ncbi:hypothetical protein [Holdemania filiformis]|uniref:hypothetical protein n=2 Tax=Holdemania filiformis TaxID=61171 RepID=UPI002676EBE0|nr:hypothetical protein [Holdemania filiformis]